MPNREISNTGAINLDLDGAALCIKPFAHRYNAPNACVCVKPCNGRQGAGTCARCVG